MAGCVVALLLACVVMVLPASLSLKTISFLHDKIFF